MNRIRKIVAVVAVLATAENALADNILRRSGASTPSAPPPGAADAAQAAAAAAQYAQGPMKNALEAIQRFQAAQDAARAAAKAAAANVPNGLGVGGLVVAPGGASWQGAERPVQSIVDGRTEVTVVQNEQKAILTWASFNVGRETDLVFDQKTNGGDAAGSWIAFNRVLDPTLAPSRILGTIKADGQVYVVNRNGVVFGGSSQVNVGTLVVSSLEVYGGDPRFRAGLLSQPGVTLGGDGTPGGAVVVESGAKLSIGAYGQALLVGGRVENHGTIEAPDGQVLMAAGSAVSLGASTTPGLRGYLLTAPVDGAGSVENTGLVSTPRGNVTMVGNDVRQAGLVTATTGAEANGSIRMGQDGGTTTLAAGSITQVLPDQEGKKVVGATQKDFVPSEVSVSGERIALEGDARIYAPGGNVALSARVSPVQADAVDGTRVYVDSGASIDVSGLRGVEVGMDQNSVEAQLRAAELRDNPLLRSSPGVRGRTVWFDRRLGVGVADLTGYAALTPWDVAEFMTGGGTVTLAANQIVTRAGSTIDLSGGSLRYLDGYVHSSYLVDASGRPVRLEDARKEVRYVGLLGDFIIDHGRWGTTEAFAAGLARNRPHFEKGYEQGSAAGTLNVTTNALTLPPPTGTDRQPVDPHPTGEFRIFDGAVVATTVPGTHQREMPSGSDDPTRTWLERALGATLNVDRAGNVTIADRGPQLPAGLDPAGTPDASLRYEHLLPARWFDGKTFSKVSIRSGYTDDRVEQGGVLLEIGTRNLAPGGHLTIGSGVVVDLGDGGSFSFSGKHAEVDGTIRAAGGSVALTALDLPSPEELARGERSGIHLGAGGAIDVAGRWSNDRLDGTGAPLRPFDGGQVRLKGRDVILDTGSAIDVSGGARLDASGTRVTAGSGGSVVLDVTQPTSPVQPQIVPFDGRLELGGSLTGYALGKGGSLSLVMPYDVVVSGSAPLAPGPWTRLLDPAFFTRGGFSSYAIVGERGVTVTAGTVLAPSVETLVLPDRPAEIASGVRLADVATRRVLDGGQVMPMSLSLSSVPVRAISPDATGPAPGHPKDVVVETGAAIRMAPGSSVSLSSVDTVYVDGTIEAAAGAIQLAARSGQDLGTQMDALGTGSVRLGANARLLAGGYEKEVLEKNVTRRTVVDGGMVVISSPHDVVVDPGAVIDVHGVRGTNDLDAAAGDPSRQAGLVPVAVDGNAGSVVVNAASGLLAGNLLLAPGGEAGRGGSLTVNASGPVVVRQDVPTSRDAAQALVVVADRIDASGADDVTLAARTSSGTIASTGQILFEGNVDLHARRSVALGFPQIGTVAGAEPATVEIRAPWVQLTGSTAGDVPAANAADLRGQLTIRADVVDVANTVVLGCATLGCGAGGFGLARLVASGDIRLSDHDDGGVASLHAGLYSGGALSLEAAQVYPTRLLDPSDPNLAPGFVVQSDVSVTVVGNGNPAPVPYAFGESITLRAPAVVQGGVVRAPQGQIHLEGTGPDGTVTLLPGSLTSASLEGLVVPFGAVATGGAFTGYDQPGQAPEKSVRIDAPQVAVREGAVVDVSGKGDLLGYVFVPGNGGSRDILSSSGGFAVLPGQGSRPIPAGGSGTLQDGRLRVGDSIWLQGVPGLADGFYTLLPAHYALLPGGVLVRPLGGSLATAPDTAMRDDGAAIVAGYRAVVGTPIRDPGFSRFLVMSHDVFGAYSELQAYSFDAFARSLAASAGVGARTPGDAGSVVLMASRSLALDGTGRFDAGPDGLLGNLDISAPRIAVLGAGVAAPTAEGYLVLRVDALDAFGAGSVLLGGVRSASTGPSGPVGTAVQVNASEVVVDTGPASALSGPEILLAATGSVTVRDGSTIRATGGGARDSNPLLLQGDGALLRLSTGDRVGIVHSDGLAGAGLLSIGNANLLADGSLSLYGTRNVALSPGATLSGRQFDLASLVVNIGEVPAGTAGTNLGLDVISRLASSADLLIRGTDSIHLYGDVALGGRSASGQATLGSITLDTGLLRGEATGTGGATITAGRLTLQDSGGGATAPAGATNGSLVLDVDALVLGPGQVRVDGFGSMRGTAGSVEVRGRGGLTTTGDVVLATGAVGASAGASYAVVAGGDLALEAGRAPAPADAATVPLGGSLSLSGRSVTLDTVVSLPAGSLEATARDGTLVVGANARLDVSGRSVELADVARTAPGGAIRLRAAGDLSVESGAVLDVSAAAGGDAGRIALASGGTASVKGELRGSGSAGGDGGGFSIDAARLADGADLRSLDAALAAGGFDGFREVRLREQEIRVAADETIRAHRIELRSDTGKVTVDGTLDASSSTSHPDGGVVRLDGGAGVSVGATARLDVSAGTVPPGEFDPASGKVEITATGGRVDLAPGAVVAASGGRSGGGKVVVRALREGSDVAVDRLSARIVGAREVDVVGIADYRTDTVDAALVDRMIGDASAWLAASRAAVASRLGANAPGLVVGAGIDVASDGDLAIRSDVDLSRIAPASQAAPGFVRLSAGGKLDVQAAVSDGFEGADRAAALRSGASATLALEAGGDVVIGPGAVVRTGTGDLSIHAGRDLLFDGARSVVYTAGAHTGLAPGFSGVPTGSALGEFATGGGDVDLRAGRDVVAPLATQTTSAWLFRYGDTDWKGLASTSSVRQQTSWSVVYGNFEQAVGALGGGDVRVDAGRDIVRLQVAIPTTGQLTSAVGSTAHASDLVVRGGGDLDLSAGRDLLGGLFLLGRGHAELRAGDRVVAEPSSVVALRTSDTGQVLGSTRPVGMLLGLMDATATVVGGADVQIEGAFDPMSQAQLAGPTGNVRSGTGTAFMGYTDRTALDVTAVGGAVTYRNDPWASVDLSRGAWQVRMAGASSAAGLQAASLNSTFSRAPGTLRLASLSGSAWLQDPFGAQASQLTLGSSATGTLEVLARGDVHLLHGVTMQGEPEGLRRGPLDPFSTTGDLVSLGVILSPAQAGTAAGAPHIHATDGEPARIVAVDGSVCAYRSGTCTPGPSDRAVQVTLDKPIEVVAGRDVMGGDYRVRADSPTALTRIEAGRDVYDVSLSASGSGGTAILEAGRDVVLHLTNQGVSSVTGGRIVAAGDPILGNTRSSDLYVIAGRSGGVDLDGFAAAYLDPANQRGVVRTYLPELRTFMKGLGIAAPDDDGLLAAFRALPAARREIFLEQVFFSELRETGIDYNTVAGPRYQSYDRGFLAISLLFPTDPAALPSGGLGSIILDGKVVETQARGDVNMLAPYGRIAVGTELANPGGKGGIVTRRGGTIRMMADGNIDLYTSRVFTLQGGDILMWTSDGSITAGSGSKTSVFYAPLAYSMSVDGLVQIDAFGLQTGAGIGVLDALQDAGSRAQSRLDLIAPKGEVNAGDAGIRVVGDLNIAAQVVVGMENIQVSGASQGIPRVETPSIGALTSASQVTQAAAKEGVGPEAAPRSRLADLPSIITVEPVGYETDDKEGQEGTAH